MEVHIMIRHIIVFVLSFSVFACSNRYIPEQAVWVDEGVSYRKYQFIEVLLVTSISKETVIQEILEGI